MFHCCQPSSLLILLPNIPTILSLSSSVAHTTTACIDHNHSGVMYRRSPPQDERNKRKKEKKRNLRMILAHARLFQGVCLCCAGVGGCTATHNIRLHAAPGSACGCWQAAPLRHLPAATACSYLHGTAPQISCPLCQSETPSHILVKLLQTPCKIKSARHTLTTSR